MDEKELIRARLTELDRLAYERNILKTSGFLSYAEQQAYHQLQKAGSFLTPTHFLGGGYEESERAAAFFLPDYMDKAEAEGAKIAVLKAEVPGEKYAEELTHRDYLGALMNLGIERDRLGDILTDGPEAYVYCLSEMAQFLCDNLLRVRHSAVTCTVCEGGADIRPRFEELSVNVASERADCVLAALYKLSRTEAQKLFAAEKVFSDGRVITDPGKKLNEESRVSVRGYGKFIYGGTEGKSRSGRLFVHIRRFV